MRSLPILLMLLLVNFSMHAQTSLPEGLGDTLTPEHAEVRFYQSLDSLPGDTIFRLTSPEGYVIQNSDYNSSVKVALKTKTGYNVFDGCPNIDDHWIPTIHRINFNGRGHDELEIRWSNGNGRSGWESGWNEASSGICIWDLDKMQLLFTFQDSYEYNFWWNGVIYNDSTGALETDSLGDIIMIDSLSGGESSCDKYDVTVEVKKITIHRQADCALTNPDEGTVLRADETTWIYDLKREGLVIRRQ